MIIGGLFSFGRPLAVVSISSNGFQPPRPYVYDDILHAAIDATFRPSPLTTINGDEAVTYLKRLSPYGTLQDPDGGYNDVMYNLPQVALGLQGNGGGIFAGGGRGGTIYPNATTEVTFENGTTRSYPNFARVLRTFHNISNGQDVFNQYLVQKLGSWPLTPDSILPPPAPGYPLPLANQSNNNNIRGFYLDGPGYDDVAVLTVGKFLGVSSYSEKTFQDTAFNFLQNATVDGKTRLVIDLRANSGGHLLHAYDLFLNLFPDIVPYGGTRLRAHEAFDLIGQTVSSVAGPVYPWNFSYPPGPAGSTILNSFLDTPFVALADMDANGEAFTSWPDKYGPHSFNDDNFTSIIRWNLSDPAIKWVNYFTVNDWNDERPGIIPARPFKAENIVLLYDGYCASTCAIFTEFVVTQAGVKTVAVGGQPNLTPMQTIGGTRGVNSWLWSSIQSFVSSTYWIGSTEQQARWNASVLSSYSRLPFTRSADSDGSVNVRDGIRQGDESQTPLQFAWYPADCRIWYEQSFTLDVVPLWKRAVDVNWGGASCVAGSTSGVMKREKLVKGTRHQSKAITQADFDAYNESMSLFTDFRKVRRSGDAEMLP